MEAMVPKNEQQRLRLLHELDILDTLPEHALDDLTLLASYVCNTPTALITLVDADRQWFKSRVGFATAETSRDVSFCSHAILQDGLFTVPDATQDPRFAGNPLVTNDPSIRFYAGSPLRMDDGLALGTLCVIDSVPRQLDQRQEAALGAISREVVTHLDLRRTVAQLRHTQGELRASQKASHDLLLNTLPEPIASRLMGGEKTIADSFDDVTVLFADIHEFAAVADTASPVQVVQLLDRVFRAFDEVVSRLGLEKIKTVGDAYMAAGGLPTPRPEHAEAVAQLALAMQTEVARVSASCGHPLSLRIGIHSGPVVAGVIGQKRFSYDLWGQTVSTASQMECFGMPGQIQVSSSTYALLKDRFVFEERGEFYVKGQGNVDTYLLKGRRR